MKNKLLFPLFVSLLLLFTSCTGISQQQHDTVLAERDAYQQQVAVLEENLLQHQDTITQLEEKFAELEQNHQQVNEQLAATNSQLEDLKQQNTDLSTKLEAAQKSTPPQSAAQGGGQPQSPATVQQNQTPAPEAPKPQTGGNLVWIPASGSKYHSHSGCSGMKNPTQVELEDAQARGYTACKKCW